VKAADATRTTATPTSTFAHVSLRRPTVKKGLKSTARAASAKPPHRTVSPEREECAERGHAADHDAQEGIVIVGVAIQRGEQHPGCR
jgi:hypothetical protein